MSIYIEQINHTNKIHHNKSNEPFLIYGNLHLTFDGQKWTYNEVLLDEPYTKHYIEEYIVPESYINNTDKTIFYAFYDNQCAGQIVIRINWNKYCFIEDLAVKTEFRKKGIASLLLKEAEKWSLQKELNGLMLETQDNNLIACNLYQRNGFILGSVDYMLYSGFNNSEKALFWYKQNK